MEYCSHQIHAKSTTAEGMCAVCLLEEGLRPSVADFEDTFGSYEILCELGEGGMGIAYLAEQARPIRREVALKVLKPGLPSPDVIARFETERQALALMDHPNIARVFDAGTSGKNRPYFVMEFVDGSPITDYCDRKLLRIPQRLALFVQVCHALDHAHRKGIIHRDIKPSNVLVTEVDGAPVPKVIDFGVAKAVGGHLTGQTVQTLESQFIGTLGYMSPEQVSMSQAAPDATTDVYSLGVLLYELLCGVLPFETNLLREAGLVGAAQIVCQEEPPSPSLRLRGMGPEAGEVARKRGVSPEMLARLLSRDLTWILYKALDKERGRRYPTPAALAADVERYLRHEPVLAGAPGPLYRAGKLLRRHRLPFLIAGVAASTIIAFVLLLSRPTPRTPLQAIPLTAYSGDETSPTFSPDEAEVAFIWSGEAQDNYDIYALRIGEPAPRRLTHDPALDFSPAWSPDRQWIAFLRAKAGHNPEVMLVNPRNGFERRLADARIVVNPQHHRLDWSADSRLLVLSEKNDSSGQDRIYALSVDTGEERPLSSPGLGEVDNSPGLSPDGRFLAFVRHANEFSASIVVLPLGPDFRPSGAERRLEIPELGSTTTLDFPRWVSSRDLIVNAWSGRQNRRLWRVSISGRKKPEILGELGEQIGIHAISRSGNKLAFSRGMHDTNIGRLDLSWPSGKVIRDRSFIASSRFDQQPAISPNGSKIAFETTRTGFSEIWLASRDGSNAAPLTRFESFAGSPRWSPDGEMIVFDGRGPGSTDADIFVISASGGQPRRITDDPAPDFLPSWSADSQYIYFCSTKTGKEEIWRVPAAGGPARRVTFHGGFDSVASRDGRWIYYSKSNSPVSSIWRVSTENGEETMVADSVRSRSFDVTARGLYFLAESSSRSTELRFLDFASSKTLTLASFDRLLRERLSVSWDERIILYTQVDQRGGDLMLVEGFR